MKDIYNKHPNLPLLCQHLGNSLLAYFESLPDNSELTLKCLLEKLTVLFLMLSEQWKQSLLAIDVDNNKIHKDKLIMLPNSSLKHAKPSRLLQAIVCHKFKENSKCFVVECAKVYIGIRKQLVLPEIKQLLSYLCGKPHKATSDDTISRWIKNTISSVNIHIDVFKAHSTCSASFSRIKQVGIPYPKMLKRGSWKGLNTFTKYYD